jgi:hypothetical protein
LYHQAVSAHRLAFHLCSWRGKTAVVSAVVCVVFGPKNPLSFPLFRPLARVSIDHASVTNGGVILTSPDENDQAPGGSGANNDLTTNVAAVWVSGRFNVRTNTSAQIDARAISANTEPQISTFGWVDTRGRFN